MGFKRRSKIFHLTFPEDSEWHGLEVDASGMSIDEWTELISIGDKPNLKDIARVADIFARHVRSWNLTDDDDNPIPVSRETVLQEDPEMVNVLAGAWLDAAVNVPAPLPQTSSDGVPFLEGSIPVDVLSASPQNSPVPS